MNCPTRLILSLVIEQRVLFVSFISKIFNSPFGFENHSSIYSTASFIIMQNLEVCECVIIGTNIHKTCQVTMNMSSLMLYSNYFFLPLQMCGIRLLGRPK